MLTGRLGPRGRAGGEEATAMRRGRVLVAGLLVMGLGCGLGGARAEGATAERRVVCFSTEAAGNDNILILEFTSRGRFVSGVTGVFGTTLGFGGSPPQPGIPMAGAARVRNDDKIEFSVTGVGIGVPVSVSGILDPPGFDAGNGHLRVELSPPAIALVTLFPQPLPECEEKIGEFADPTP
jgi:hypothetical protein